MTAGMGQWETRRMTRNYGTHKKDKRGTRGGSREREGKPKRMHKLIVASVAGANSSGGGGGVESRGRGRGYMVRLCVQDACNRIHTCTHTHTDRLTHAGCRKTLGKVNLLI